VGCIKLDILNEQYKRTEFKVSYFKKELTSNFCAKNARRYLYHLKDHLGSPRVVFEPSGTTTKVTQVNAYYPFGAPIAALSWVGTSDNRYKHTGMETISDFDLGYVDNGARWRGSAYAGSNFLSIDQLAEKYPHLSPYIYCAGNPISFFDPDGRERYYATNGNFIGQVGTNTDVRVINSNLTTAQANTHIQNGANDALMNNSVSFANYFTTVADVTNDAALQTYSNNGNNCNAAARAQMSDAGVTLSGGVIHTLVDNTASANNKDNNNANLTADPHGGAIRIQTELNSGNPVMVGVKETTASGTYPNANNANALTGHFVVIRSSTVAADGTVSFNYLDNASTANGKSPNNNFTLNTSTGAITDNVVPARSNYQRYDITEVRKNN